MGKDKYAQSQIAELASCSTQHWSSPSILRALQQFASRVIPRNNRCMRNSELAGRPNLEKEGKIQSWLRAELHVNDWGLT